MSITNFIPSEIIVAILFRLPPQSLARFRWVSKEWNSVISDHKFIKTHTHQLLLQPKPAKKLIAMSTTTRSLYSIELNIDKNYTMPATAVKEITFGSPPPMRWRNILGSCNGLVLARDENETMFLMNPTTHDLWKLPVNPLVYYIHMRTASYGFGFGYDSSTDDYKVVCICVNEITTISYGAISIYSLRNNSWRKLPDNPHNDYDGQSCALVNGKCHWLTKDSKSIIAFSFVDEFFFKIKTPDPALMRNFRFFTMVVEIGGRLGVYVSYVFAGFELWVMQEYGDSKSWARVFSHTMYTRPLCLLEGSDRDIVVDGGVHGVGVFNVDEGGNRNVRIVGDPSWFTIEGSFGESIESTKRIIKTP